MQELFFSLPTIELDDIILRKIMDSDIGGVYDIYCNEKVFLFLPGSPKTDRNTIKKLISEFNIKFQRSESLFWGICLAQNPQQVIGIIEVYDISPKVNMVSIGYRLCECMWGKGIASKALKAVVQYLFAATAVNRIQAFTLPQNMQSEKVLLKNSFLKEGLLRQAQYWEDKGIVDVTVYSLLREQSVAVQTHLTGNRTVRIRG